jgi:uncharacterized membrane protein
MSEIHSNRDALSMAGWGSYSVITVSFEDDDNAYAALTLLKELDSQHQVGLDEAVVLVRQADGRVVEQDYVASSPLPNAIGGGLIGLLVGIIGGPLGMLIGGATGSFAGSLVDIEDEENTPTALTAISSSARPGRTALLAVVKEQSWQVVDAAMSGLGGTVLRRSVYEVEAEIAAAEQAERTAKREARKELLRGRREHDQEAAHAKVENLKARRGSRPNHADRVTTSHPSEYETAGMEQTARNPG